MRMSLERNKQKGARKELTFGTSSESAGSDSLEHPSPALHVHAEKL
jgi:hypothetical protein